MPASPLVGYDRIGELGHVTTETARTWWRRRLLPPPSSRRHGRPLWREDVIRTWLRSTGRATATPREELPA